MTKKADGAATVKGRAVRFVGGGAAIIPGIPARDLTQAEWEALTEEQRQAALASGLYVDAED